MSSGVVAVAVVRSRPSDDDHSHPGAPEPGPGAVPGPSVAPENTPATIDASPARWTPAPAPAVQRSYLRPIDSDAWPVGFSPSGEALPETLTDVLLRGSHAIRSSKRAEAQRLERAAAVASHVDAQIRDFLELCAVENLVPPIMVRPTGTPRHAPVRPDRDGRPRPAPRLPGPDEDGHRHPDPTGAHRGQRHRRPAPARRRERLQAWPLLYWRCESFPAAGRSLHLFVEPGGRTFEGRDDPAPLTVQGREVRVWPVDAAAIVEGMAEVDARRCALHLVHGMAHLLWRAGVGL